MTAGGQQPDAVRSAVIGLGEIGKEHVEGIRRSPSASPTAVGDVQPALADRLALGPDVRVYADYRELLGDDAVDAVCICVPHDQHHAIALAAIAAGKHILVEKPLALTVAECD